MKLTTVAFACLTASMLGGCAGSDLNPIHRSVAFNEAEYIGSDAVGTGSVTGQAFLVTLGGTVKYGAGRTVCLDPVTSYSTQWFDNAVVASRAMKSGDERAGKYRRSTIADGEGRFKFKGLPAGDYYATCHITWFIDAITEVGGTAHAKVTVVEGQNTEAVLTEPLGSMRKTEGNGPRR
jgi:hypothetical protein